MHHLFMLVLVNSITLLITKYFLILKLLNYLLISLPLIIHFIVDLIFNLILILIKVKQQVIQTKLSPQKHHLNLQL